MHASDHTYELACDNGFSGTVQEWLASLKGDQGDQGIQGETGAQGPQGEQGIQGVGIAAINTTLNVDGAIDYLVIEYTLTNGNVIRNVVVLPLTKTNTTSEAVQVATDTIDVGGQEVTVSVVAVEYDQGTPEAEQHVSLSSTTYDDQTTYTAAVPNGVALIEGASTLTLAVEPVNDGAIAITDGTMTTGFDITIPEVSEHNSTVITVVLPIEAGLNPANISIDHDGTPMTRVNSLAEIADNTFYYDAATGNLTLGVTSFSTFELSIDNYDVTVATAAELVDAIADGSKIIHLGADIVPETSIEISRSVRIIGNDHKLKANISGNGTIVFENIYTTNITVQQNGGFIGTLIFNGGWLDTDRPGTADSAAAFYSRNNPNASFEFRNMNITANITKGIKIYNAKSVLIDNCEFDATKLAVVQGGTNSDIQSLSLVDIQIDVSGTDITITNSHFEGAPQGSIAVPNFINENGEWADSDTGAAIKLKVEKGAQYGNVVISGNTFVDNYRDVLVGTAPYANQLQAGATAASNGRSAEGLKNNVIDGWTITDNTTTFTADVVAARGVATLSYIGGQTPFNKYTTYVGNVGEIVDGCAVWVIGNAFEKVDGVWYYKDTDGTLYSVAVVDGAAVLTPFVQQGA